MRLTEKFVQFISLLLFMMFLGIGIIRTEKCWPNSPTYSTDVGVLRGWGRAQITVDILGREAKKVEKHCTRPYIPYKYSLVMMCPLGIGRNARLWKTHPVSKSRNTNSPQGILLTK